MVNSGSVEEGGSSLAQPMVDTWTDCGKLWKVQNKHVASRMQKGLSKNKYFGLGILNSDKRSSELSRMLLLFHLLNGTKSFLVS
jgi:hypothetical protein